ncbi:MAG: helix-turn-helix transcriptional regulator [Mucilaginibacter sp.]
MKVLQQGLYLADTTSFACVNGVRITRTAYRPNPVFEEMHAHANPHFSLVLCGGNLEKRKNKELERTPGKLTFYHSGELHQNLHGARSSQHLNIELEPAFFAWSGLNETELSDVRCSDPAVKFQLIKIGRELSFPDELSALNVQWLFLELLEKSAAVKKGLPGWLKILDAYLQEHFRETLSLEELARICGVHPVTISKHFPAFYGHTLGEHVRQLRIDASLALIKTTQLTLSEIAAACGFADQSHFIRNFKSYTGFMPKKFRRL